MVRIDFGTTELAPPLNLLPPSGSPKSRAMPVRNYLYATRSSVDADQKDGFVLSNLDDNASPDDELLSLYEAGESDVRFQS